MLLIEKCSCLMYSAVFTGLFAIGLGISLWNFWNKNKLSSSGNPGSRWIALICLVGLFVNIPILTINEMKKEDKYEGNPEKLEKDVNLVWGITAFCIAVLCILIRYTIANNNVMVGREGTVYKRSFWALVVTGVGIGITGLVLHFGVKVDIKT